MYWLTCTCGWCLAAGALQVGNIMAEFPLDPQLAKMMVASPEFKYEQIEPMAMCTDSEFANFAEQNAIPPLYFSFWDHAKLWNPSRLDAGPERMCWCHHQTVIMECASEY